MSLRLKLAVLVVGAIAVPIVVMLLSFRLETDLETVRAYWELMKAHRVWVRSRDPRPIDPTKIQESLAGVPPFAEIRVFDEEGELLFRKAPKELTALIRRDHMTTTVPVEFTTGEKGLIIVARPASPFIRREDHWYVPLTGLLFVTVMVIFISRSMSRSINRLEQATRRVVEGDLEFELPIRGNDTLASLTRSFDAMRRHLKEEYARRSRFIMGISHDLKTPLSSISGYTDAIREGYADSTEKLRKYAGIIEDKTKLLESRISMLIEYARRETSEWSRELEPVTLSAFLTEVATVFDSEISLRKRVFHSRIEVPADIVVPMDEEMMLRALENLLQNAVKYSPRDSTITFECTNTKGNVTVALSNEGPGIDLEMLPHVFDPFVRGAPGRKGSGMGLGLATVESVITSHGWRIEVESESGATTFRIAIPIGPPETDTNHSS